MESLTPNQSMSQRPASPVRARIVFDCRMANDPTMMPSTIPEQQPRQAPPFGRVLRILLGLVLMIYVTPVYFQVPARVAAASLLLMLGLIGVYSLIHIVAS